MHFASYNSNYEQFEESTATVAKDYTKTTTTDGKTVIRFVDVYQLDAAATYGIRFSVKIPSDATVGDQTVAIEAKVAKDKTTENTETLLPEADITVTAGKITVKPTTAEPEEIQLTFQHTLSLKSNINIAIVPTLTGTVFKTDDRVKDIYAISQQEKLDDNDNAYTYTSDKYRASSNGYFYYGDLLAYEMSHDVTTIIYGCDADGNVLYKSNIDTYSVIDYVASNLAKSSSTDDLKTVLANLLVYGAAAQTYAKYETDSLVTGIGNVETKNGTVNISKAVATHKTSTDPVLATCEANNGDENLPKLNKTLALKSAVVLSFVFNKDLVTATDNVKLVVNYDSKNYEYAVSDFGEYSSTMYRLDFSEIIAANFGYTVTATLYDGETPLTRTLTYSVESYCLKQINNSTDADLVAVCKAIMSYGKSVDNYFS